MRNFEKSFFGREKNGFKKDPPALPPRELFHVINKSSYSFFRSIKRAEIALAEAVGPISAL